MMRMMEGAAERPASGGASSGGGTSGFGASIAAGEALGGASSRTKSWSLIDMLDPDYVQGGGMTRGASSSGGLSGMLCFVLGM
jgi:hypothetical protein